MYKFKSQNYFYELRVVDEGIIRIRVSAGEKFSESLMSRYGILTEPGDLDARVLDDGNNYSLSADELRVTVDKASDSLTLSGARSPISFSFGGYQDKPYANHGFKVTMSLTENERLFGIGDESRKSIARRGTVARLDMRNVVSYGPIPYLMSTNGWGMLVNCTYAHTYDMGSTASDKLIIESHKGVIDLYLFIPKSHTLADTLDLYTRVSGKPVVMPKFFYGYTFVLNEQTNAREMLNDCLMFRREDIPCDTVGLEPQWMTNHYDRSVNKKMSDERFYTPGWLPENQSGVDTYFYTLREMGFKFSLWLCNDYDLLWEEERRAGEVAAALNKEYSYEGASILDPHFACPSYMDGVTKRDEPWFEHLKKFVDNGASAFKLDGAFQTNDHPDRLWAGKYFDDEVHNIYPVFYVKQMLEGFRDHTNGRRALIYTPCIYAGSQRYCASWAGDTGGGYDTVVAMLNFGLSGHVNVTCDMEATQREGIHYSFLSPWTQQLGWRNWHQPWFLRPELENMIRYYSKLRSSLFPYIYSMAHKAAQTALPLARALTLMYPDRPEYDDVTNAYMFGDSLYVAVFDMNITLPEGKWYDWFTGDVYEGGRTFEYNIPEGRGGALLVKAGGIVAAMEPQDHIDKIVPDRYTLHVFPGDNGDFTLVEDDGWTYDYMSGKAAKTRFAIENTSVSSFELAVDARVGSYTGRPIKDQKFYDESSEPKMYAMNDGNCFDVIISAAAESVSLDGKPVAFTIENGKTKFFISKDEHKKSLRYSITL